MTALLWLMLLPAQPSVTDLLEARTLEELRRFEAGFEGVLGVAAVDLETGRSIAVNGDTVFPQASVIKVPILIAMFGSGRRLTDAVTLTANDAVGGSGRLQHQLKEGPVTLSEAELVTAMIEHSDNTATNKCIELVGMAAVNRMLDELAFPRTRLRRKMMDSAAARRDQENVSTPNEMARLMAWIYRAPRSKEMLEILRKVRAGIAEGLPLDVDSAAKTGQIPGARGEAGIVFLSGRPFALSVMSAYIDDRRTPVPEVTRIVYHHFEKLARANRYGHRVR